MPVELGNWFVSDCVNGANPARIPSTTLPGSIPPRSIFHSSAFAWLPKTSALSTMKATKPQRAITTPIINPPLCNDVNRIQTPVSPALGTQDQYPDFH